MNGPHLMEDGKLNPGYLKLDLLCKGMRIAADGQIDSGRPVRRVRAGLGSGLELRIPGPDAIHVNVPVVEPFARVSPYELHGPRSNGHHWITFEGREVGEVRLPPRPAFYDQRTSSGKTMSEVGILQGTYLGVYLGGMCINWLDLKNDSCRFCSVGANLNSGDEAPNKTADDVVETAAAARDESGITFVHLNGGFEADSNYLDLFGPVLRKLREKTGLLTGLQVPPLPDFKQYGKFKAFGVNNLSLCYEVWNPARFQEVCPGKARRAGLQRYKDAIQYCAQEVGFDTTNGEMIAGLEDPGDSIAAIDWLTSIGAVPTICVFRPVAGSLYAHQPPPRVEDMIPIFAHGYVRCMESGLPIGVAPNVHVSLVMNPEECRWLLPPGKRDGWALQRLKLTAMRKAFGAYFRSRLKLKARTRAGSPIHQASA